MIAIIDYGSGNLASVEKALHGVVTSDPYKIDMADKIVFPGAGSFSAAVSGIKNIRDIIIEKIRNGTPYLGICLGLEILFSESEEGPGTGLSFFNERLKRFKKGIHMGWNTVEFNDNIIFSGIKKGEYFYFVHRYYAPLGSYTCGKTFFNGYFTSFININNIYAVQFHPEKSGEPGLKLLRNFGELA
ncbi:imidazole glycerol phosphate synthase subunit hisH [Picrophilus oshimae DSM 9789]|uniref:Imidazole glycerol phosphate synthase subunit HisH n=3 Tax=Picrophilus oshimae TaxID=46632 RepID=HIS5_PICTO|nr:imidazole glycerol phosphate synthase subunit HisH [Picrophilus oshimae]Q6KZD3.1 RecName: Full=Imidazole glycerol phosphate synthase subunit HisH; AltName: Full=IGP synthase glutaminase subunit; AltName: Full=IGP synthase subunit HisH; AltName: Full=ImGP synthase subunit HisH; Short=IGPS subunit HisH [Picrophilus oshimae DSM 9789]AAT43919.1 imidazole glycerol phosphate synthase subunit HisH [Picrophilus oshimae DSM 9789]SMD31010.1 imidazole glycerol phosphate synthase subunit hisH [Picrophilu